MRPHIFRTMSFALAALIVTACSSSSNQALPTTPSANGAPAALIDNPTNRNTSGALTEAPANQIIGNAHWNPVCGSASAGYARCHSWLNTSIQPNVQPKSVSAQPAVVAYEPANLQAAYKLPSNTNGSGQTVAIVDAYDDPNAESNLGYYRSYFGLPACTTANGCFKKVNESGVQGNYPAGNTGWGLEISLDLDMVSAICPKCHILLVEATSNAITDLSDSVNTAAALHANTISNSYGASEGSYIYADYTHYNHPGTAITASTGDSGYAAGPQYPATNFYVTAVGGTSLTQASNARGWSETAWSGGGSGCSAYFGKPYWQHDSLCPNRTEADVAAVADPNTGVWIYDTYGYGGWEIVGGTSVSSPIVASTYALAGNAGSVYYGSYPYAHTSSLYDIVSGSNGSCGGTYLCTAQVGYDGPTGWGTPNGIGAF